MVSPRFAVAFYGVTLFTFLAASAAPTPLYRLYQEAWGFPPAVLPVVFGVYAFALLAALLFVGSLSDHVGRRPVVFAALCLDAAAMLLFLRADDAWGLAAARIDQGFATGLATSALGAALIDASPILGPFVNAVAPMVGMAAGALGAGIVLRFAPDPLHLVYAVPLALFMLQGVLLWLVPESAALKRGAWGSLKPRVALPVQARRAFLSISPPNVAIWSVGGLYLSLVPSIIRLATGIESPLLAGFVVAGLTLSGTAGILALRRKPAATILAVGTSVMALGVAIFLAGIHLAAVALLVAGTVVTGFGFGAGFLGALRTVMPLARPEERAGLLSAFYIESYLAFCVPAILAGFGAARFGLIPATTAYGAVVILLSLAGFAAARRVGRATACPSALS